jgi:hypothetical protein
MNAIEGGMRRGRAHEESDNEDYEGVKMVGQEGEYENGDMDEGDRRLIQAISNIGKGIGVELPSFSRSLEPNEIFDWIIEMDE